MQTGQNGSNWYWRVDLTTKKLVLQLSERITFPTEYKAEDITDAHLSSRPFSTADAFLYSLFRDKFDSQPFNEESAFTLAVNATASSHYLKPQATKSWYFEPNLSDATKRNNQGDLVTLKASTEAIYLILDSDDCASNIMLVSSIHLVDNIRTFKRGKVLRVHNDRLHPVLNEIQEQL